MKTYLNFVILICVYKLCSVSCQSNQRDLIIVFDTTSSMTDDLVALRTNAVSVVNDFNSRPSNPISRYILLEFNDPTVPAAKKTKDKDEFLGWLNAITLYGGGDCPEQCFKGILMALNEARHGSFLFVFTDASTQGVSQKDQIKALASRKSVKIFFFMAAFCYDKAKEHGEYKEVAFGTQGLLFDTNKGDIGEIFKGINSIINTDLSIGDAIVSKEPTGSHAIDVDSTAKEIDLVFTGTKPQVTILDPNKVVYTMHERVIESDIATIIKIRDPMPGSWTVNVAAGSPYSGIISLISDLTFKYGFSQTVPASISHTSFVPLLGSTNYLAISTSNDSLIGILSSVDLVSEKVIIRNLPLTRHVRADGEIIYVTDGFPLPPNGFKFYINGKDFAAKKIRRLLSPEIYGSTGEEKPDVTDFVDFIRVQEGESIKLACLAKSYLQITVQWKKQGSSAPLAELTSNSSTTLLHVIKSASLSDSGSYICTSTNRHGHSEVTTVVDVRKTPLTVRTPNELINPYEESDAVLKCTHQPITDVTINWTYNGSPTIPFKHEIDGPNLVLKNVLRNMNGDYTCTGSRGGETKSDTMKVEVFYKPKITTVTATSNYNVTDVPDIFNVFNVTSLSLACTADGNPIAKVSWKKDNVLISANSQYTFATLDETQSGKYVCVAENSWSKSSKQVELKFFTKPEMKTNYKLSYEIARGSPLKIECPVTDSSAKITWWTSDDKPLTKYVGLSSELNIPAIDIDMHQKIYCVAENVAGTEKAEFDIIVNFEPKITEVSKIDDHSTENVISKSSIDVYNTTSLKLNCIAEGNPSPSFLWKYVSGREVTHHGPSIVIDPSKLSSSGTYKCVAQNNKGTSKTELTVNIINKPVLLSYEEKQTLLEGTTFTLKCPITGDFDSITWFMHATPVPTSKIVSDSLVLSSVTSDMGGAAYCIASNKAGSTKAPFTFSFLSKIRNIKLRIELPFYKDIDYEPSTLFHKVNITSGNSLRILCEPNGLPAPKIAWFKNGLLLADDHELYVSTVLDSNAGIYSCRSQNDAGSMEVFLDIAVISHLIFDSSTFESSTGIRRRIDNELTYTDAKKIDKHFFTNHQFEKDIIVSKGESVSLDCTMTGSPTPTYSWIQNNDADKISLDPTLHFPDAKVKNSGIYKCTGTSNEKSISVMFYLHVVDKPKLIEIANDTTVAANDKILLSCSFEGNFIPQVEWRADGHILVSNKILYDDELYRNSNWRTITKLLLGSKRIIASNGTVITDKSSVITSLVGQISYLKTEDNIRGTFDLYIPQAMDSDSNQYECRIDDDSKFVHVTVGGMAPFSPLSEKTMVMVAINQPVKIHCDMGGNPKPTLEWLENGVAFDPARSNIELDPTMQFITFLHPDSTTKDKVYKCIGRNVLGDHTVSIKVSAFFSSRPESISAASLGSTWETIQVKEHESTELKCSLFTTNQKITWYEITKWPTLSRKMILRNSPYLLITPKKDVKYLCTDPATAENIVYNIVVVTLPVIKNKYTGVLDLGINDRIHLLCDANGTPTPTITWYKSEASTWTEIPTYLIYNGAFRKLAELSDTARYKCIAKNSVGDVSFEQDLVVSIKYDYEDFGIWSPCSASCGLGIKIKRRACIRKDTLQRFTVCPDHNPGNKKEQICQISVCT